MNLHSIATHTVDLDLLPEAPRVLDAGCRDFDFTKGILALRPKADIIAIDPDPDTPAPEIPGVFFARVALVGDKRPSARYFIGSTGHGNFLSDLESYYDMRPVDVPCVSLNAPPFEETFDLVKLDIEGSEFEVLEHWPGPVAKQISVEFHDWDKPHIRDSHYYERIFRFLGTFGYRVIQHELSTQGTGCGHWDSLLVLR